MSAGASEIVWEADGTERRARFLSARGGRPPKRAVLANDETTADAAYLLASQGEALIWSGDYHNARQLLQALGRRFDRKRKPIASDEPAAAFHAWRQAQAQRANLLGLLLVPLADGRVPLRRAPDVSVAVAEALGTSEGGTLLPLRDLLAMISAHEWRKNGVPIGALGGVTIHPHYGVFPPTRQDYVNLVAQAPLPATDLAFDLGTGTGVLSAVLLHRGVDRVVATDNSERALTCAADNFDRLGLARRVTLEAGRLWPDGKAGLIVCNPPWLPAKASTSVETAVYDPDAAMLHEFLAGLSAHLRPGGEGWLIMSDLSEHLGLRRPGELQAMISAAGLSIVGRLDANPSSRGARDSSDPLHFARSREVVSLWRLRTSP